jgi:hypothetical protein
MSKAMFAFLSFHLIVVLFVNTNHLMADYYDLYHPLSQRPAYNRLSNHVLDSDVFGLYAAYSGTNSSYGFYAPTVGSEFYCIFGLYKDKKLQHVFTGPALTRSESNLRYSLTTLPVQDMLVDSNSVATSYMKVMMHEMSRYARNIFQSDDLTVSARIRMYKYPTPAEYLSGKEKNTVLIKRYEFSHFK